MEPSASQANRDLPVKTEPFDGSPSPEQLDDDIYEDAGDVDFADYSSGVFLTRIPKYLFKSWSELDDEQDVQVGTVRVEGRLENPQGMSLMLSPGLAANRKVPKEYNLQITNKNSSNTFVFTEKDLPGFNNRKKAFNKQVQDESALPFSQAQPRVQFHDRGLGGTLRVDKGKRMQNYRRAIPKRTALTGRVGLELNCLAVEDDDFRRIMSERNKYDSKPVRETIFMSGAGVNALDPAALGPTGNLSNFIKNAIPSKPKGQDNKTARIPQNDLLDMIQGCFKQYRYWHFKTLKDKLKQPDTYLKQTLELCAQMVRQGPQANTWQLKKEYRDLVGGATDVQAPADADAVPDLGPVARAVGGVGDGTV